MDKIMAVRVGTLNNFNCTDREFKALDRFAKAAPWAQFFVNINIKTRNLEAILDHEYPAVVTVNPDLVPDQTLARRLLVVRPRLAFARLKWIPGTVEQLLDWLAFSKIPTVVTAQRFKCFATLDKFADRSDYARITNNGVPGAGWFKIQGAARQHMISKINSLRNVYLCDKSGQGCPACGNCSKLTMGHHAPVEQLNLSQSGLCNRGCPDCYATAQIVRMKHIVFDKVYANSKMQGHANTAT